MKTNKLPNVSVVIVVYNEKDSISRVISQIQNQHEDTWKLREILVYCDGSTDATDIIAKKLARKNKKIKVYSDPIRKGKVARLNQAFKKFRADLLVLFDGDIFIKDNFCISNMISEIKSPSVMVVGANSLAVRPKTFFERAVYSALTVYYDSRYYLKNGHNAFGCTGAGMLINGNFAHKIKIPDIIANEDYFIYLKCIKDGFIFRLARNAVVEYKIAANLRDYLKQVFRSTPEAVKEMFKDKFGDLCTSQYARSKFFYLISIIKSIIRDPLPAIYMIFIRVCCIPFYPIISKNYRLGWYRSDSTK